MVVMMMTMMAVTMMMLLLTMITVILKITKADDNGCYDLHNYNGGDECNAKFDEDYNDDDDKGDHNSDNDDNVYDDVDDDPSDIENRDADDVIFLQLQLICPKKIMKSHIKLSYFYFCELLSTFR